MFIKNGLKDIKNGLNLPSPCYASIKWTGTSTNGQQDQRIHSIHPSFAKNERIQLAAENEQMQVELAEELDNALEHNILGPEDNEYLDEPEIMLLA
jgi:hypothetical protein